MTENKYLPFVSSIVPCRNEEKFIGRCLESIIANDYPKDKLEILIVDGRSEDGTREIVKEYAQKYPFLKLIENPRKITPAAMNIGIQNSKGEIIIKMDAHSLYEKDYISKCVKHLEESGADNVGGVLETLPSKDNIVARAIAICLSYPFGAGTSYFRTGSREPREVDTVAFGCYWKKIFDKIGFYNEKMAKIEDFELNYRLRKAGGKIMLFPDIKAIYYPSSENLKQFSEHNFTDGIWTTYHLRFSKRLLVSWRHLVPFKFVLSLISLIILSFFSNIFFLLLLLIIILYFLISIFFSLKIAKKEKDFTYLSIMPIFFASRHIGYGLGSIWGIIKILTKWKS